MNNRVLKSIRIDSDIDSIISRSDNYSREINRLLREALGLSDSLDFANELDSIKSRLDKLEQMAGL